MKSVLIVALLALTLPAMAQDRPQLTPEQKWEAANVATALTVGWLALPVAIITGKRAELCALMGGKFDLSAQDQCAGGQWGNVALFLKEKKQ